MSVCMYMYHCFRHFLYCRLLVTVLKQDTILELKVALCELIDRAVERELLVLAEVKQGCISRLLVSGWEQVWVYWLNLSLQGDSIALKQLTFSRGEKLYCFEMMPQSELTTSLHTHYPWTPPNGQNQEQNTFNGNKEFDMFGSEPFISDSGTSEEGRWCDVAWQFVVEMCFCCVWYSCRGDGVAELQCLLRGNDW